MAGPTAASAAAATPATASTAAAAAAGVAAAGSSVPGPDSVVPQPRLSEFDTADAALLDTLLRQAPVGFALLGPDLRFRRVNDALAKLHGHDPAEHIGRSPADVWPAEVAAQAASAAQRVLSDGQPVFESGPGARQAQSWFPCHDQQGLVSGVVLIVADVAAADAEGSQPAALATDTHAEETIRRSEERYRSLVQGGAQMVWVADADGGLIEDCPEWRWVTGQTLEQYLGQGWLDAVHPEDRDRVERDWQGCVKSGKTFDDRYRVRTRAGSYRHYDVRAVPIERDGKIVEWVGASTDVTGQREAEEMRGRLTEQLSAAALRTARLQQATSMLAEALTVEQVVEVITEVGRTAIGAQRSAVALLDGGRLRVINPAGMPPGQSAASRDILLDSPGVMTRAIATRRPVLAEDVETLRALLEDAPLEIVAGEDERSWVGLPLLAAGAPLGALRFSFGRPRKITEEERVFLEALAGQCALAVERAAMYEREHTTAETLQRSLLPDRLPIVPGLVMEARYLPVARNMEIGGDWYDSFRLPDGRLAITVGDVMGKGLTAAAGMGRVRNALRALALTDPRPAAVLTGLDRLFSATELEEQVTTVAYLVIDPQTGDGLMGNAGHLPVLRLGAGTEPYLDETEAGTPLGWPSPRQQHPFRLPPGSTAVLYSDGLVENRLRGLDRGLNELVTVATRARASVVGHPERLLSYLVDAMLAGHEQDDDVTVLVLHVPEREREDTE
jgi:PAS domain S-box-containing protein